MVKALSHLICAAVLALVVAVAVGDVDFRQLVDHDLCAVGRHEHRTAAPGLRLGAERKRSAVTAVMALTRSYFCDDDYNYHNYYLRQGGYVCGSVGLFVR